MLTIRTRQPGFTIVELLIVIVIIGILAAITIVAYNGIQQRARDSRRGSDIIQLQKALGMYEAENGAYPQVGTANTGYDIQTLATPLNPYMKTIPDDPQKGQSGVTNYQYVTTGGGAGYGIRISYESKPQCKILVNKTTTEWWGTATPVC